MRMMMMMMMRMMMMMMTMMMMMMMMMTVMMMMMRMMTKMKTKKTRTKTKKAWSCPEDDKGPPGHGQFMGQQTPLPLMARCLTKCSSSTEFYIALKTCY